MPEDNKVDARRARIPEATGSRKDDKTTQLGQLSSEYKPKLVLFRRGNLRGKLKLVL